MAYAEDELIPISAIQHWVFCPRQCGLIHLEGLWMENRLTAEGRRLHEKAHNGKGEQRGGLRIERGLPLRSLALGITGVADVVEFHDEPAGMRLLPVEYKRGRSKTHNADRLQLCAQAACLEEMLHTNVEHGALFYGAAKRREDVAFTPELRHELDLALGSVRRMLASGQTPPPRSGPHCGKCSLHSHCLPEQVSRVNSASGFLRRRIKEELAKP